MKQQLIVAYFVLAFSLIFVSMANAQALVSNSQLHLQTDKNIYVSGESIAFKCVLSSVNNEKNASLFIDLCGENFLLTSYILKANNEQWNGKVVIPDSLQTGVYLLRAYIGNDNGLPLITSQLINVLNRFGDNSNNEEKQKTPTYYPLYPPSYIDGSDKLLRVSANNKQYERNETVQISIENNLPDCVGGISLSVFKTSEQIPVVKSNMANYKVYTPSDEIKIYDQFTIRGAIFNQSDNSPAINETVYFSIPDSIAQIKYDFTNNNGIFKFVINNLSTHKNIIIQTQTKNTPYKIQLYPSHLLPPSKIPFYIPNEIIKSAAAQLDIQRATLHLAYTPEKSPTVPNIQTRYPFYGIAKSRVIPNKYVDLNDFKEIAWEILPLVKYRNTKDSVSLKLIDLDLNQIYSDPLILVDGVPISSPEKLNLLNSKMIKWIDIQPQIRCYGSLFLKGILNIQTYNGDFSDIDLPNNAIRTEVEKIYDQEQKEAEKPFFRDVLKWCPYIDSATKKEKINVLCSHETGTYIAVAQAFDAEGNLYRSVFQFEVIKRKN